MSTTFSITRDQLIASALRLQGMVPLGGTPDATLITNMAQALQIMLKAWSSRGLKVWCVVEVNCALAANLRTFQIGPTAVGTGAKVTDRPLRIEEAFLRMNPASATPTDVTLQQLSRNEYQMLGNKFATGTPNSFFYDQQIPNGQVYLYLPVDTGAASYEVHLFSRKQIDDMNNANDVFNLPSEWYQAIRWGLAAETGLENEINPGRLDRIEKKAAYFLEEMESWDREYTSVFFQPDQRRQ